ncbi:hypothetical protein [Streptomyces sp. WAC06614]|uniref:hypothetical protein n=1 Tax=Streptomyces sp. WAC06614 TaxID=2487416 RepID=UPI000F7A28AC|nr:hypothetical protein [Streptomyces sp. WAC06614]RSS62108.1 hypothetical protein EF918_31490 [Streptomyces sp. WAC06614]
MTTAEHLETIDRLRTRDFPDVRRRSEVGVSGPGYHLAELGGSRWYGDEDAADRTVGEEQTAAEFEALRQLLEERWGKGDPFSVLGLRARALTEELPQPWRDVCGTTEHVDLWRVEERWVALYEAQWGADHSPQVTAVVTVVEPP